MPQRKYIKPAWLQAAVCVKLEVALRGPDDAVLLGFGHALCATAKMRIFAVTDFGEYEAVTILHDQVDFAQPAAEITRHRLEAAGVQKSFRRAFPVFTACAAVRQGLTMAPVAWARGIGRPPLKIAKTGSRRSFPPDPVW